MDLKKLFQLQKALDKRIITQHNLCNKKLLSKKILALQVEISELANEIKCFKFWSNKNSSNKENILEEYVDCLHFLLTIGLEKGFEDISTITPKEDTYFELTEQFLNLFVDINDFFVCSCKDHYLTLFEDFLNLGKSLKFTDKDIEQGYLRKNHINHQRQDNNY